MIESRSIILINFINLRRLEEEVKLPATIPLNTGMNTLNRIKRSVANRSDDVLLRNEFDQFGSAAQVGRALRELLMDGTLVRLGLGVYAKAKPSVLTLSLIHI